MLNALEAMSTVALILAVCCLGLILSLIHLNRRHRAARHTIGRLVRERNALLKRARQWDDIR